MMVSFIDGLVHSHFASPELLLCVGEAILNIKLTLLGRSAGEEKVLELLVAELLATLEVNLAHTYGDTTVLCRL